jgi:hypothetical protein
MICEYLPVPLRHGNWFAWEERGIVEGGDRRTGSAEGEREKEAYMFTHAALKEDPGDVSRDQGIVFLRKLISTAKNAYIVTFRREGRN